MTKLPPWQQEWEHKKRRTPHCMSMLAADDGGSERIIDNKPEFVRVAERLKSEWFIGALPISIINLVILTAILIR